MEQILLSHECFWADPIDKYLLIEGIQCPMLHGKSKFDSCLYLYGIFHLLSGSLVMAWNTK